MTKNKILIKKIIIWTMIVLGLAAMELPGVFFIQDKIRPYIFNLPFIYGYVLCCWIYLCIVIIIAYFLNWGNAPVDKKAKNKTGQDL